MKKRIRQWSGVVFCISALIGAGDVGGMDYYVAQNETNAADTNPGTREAPLKTISAAAKIVQPGDTVIVRPGVYRECVSLTNSGVLGKPIVFQSEEPFKAVICGSDVMTNLTDEGGGAWSFEAPELRPGPWQPDPWVYVEENPLERVDVRERLMPGSFYPDAAGKRVYFMPEEGADIRKARVEFARREGLIRPFDMHANSRAGEDPLLDDIHIRGFTLIHNAGWARGRPALLMAGRRWLVENNRIVWSSFQGIDMKFCNGAVVRSNEITWCGDTAIGGAPNANLLIENNRVTCNNWRRIDPSWEGGGSKWCQTVDSRVRANEWAYNYGPGVWFDVANGYNVIEQNVGHDNEWGSIFSEISWDFIIQDNINFNNGPIIVGESPGTVLWRNISFNNERGIHMRGDYRRWNNGEYGSDANWTNAVAMNRASMAAIPDIRPIRVEQWTADFLKYWIAPKAQMLNNCVVWENLSFDNVEGYFEARDYDKHSETDPFINNFSDYNIFWSTNPASLFMHAGGSYASLKAWQKASGRDTHSVLANPRDPRTALPAWAQAKRAYWETPYRPMAEILALKLGLVPGPVSRLAIGRLLRSPLVRPVALSDRRIKAFLFEVEGQKVLGLWTTMPAERRYLRLKFAGATVTVENGYLRKEQRALANGELDLVATFLPTYVYGVTEPVTEGAARTLDAQPFNLPDQPVPVTATVANPGKTPLDVTAEFTASAGYKPYPATVKRTLASGETAELKIRLMPDNSLRKGFGRVRIQARLNNTEILSRMALFSIGEGSGRIPWVSHPLTIDGSLEDWGEIVSKGMPIGLISDTNQFCNGDVKLWHGVKDASAKIYAAWTTNALYVAVQVTDDVIVPSPPGGDPWSYDAVEVFVDGRSPEMQWQTTRTEDTYQIGIGPGADDRSLPIVKVLAASPLHGYQAATKRTADGYIAELMIPLTLENFASGGWKALRPIKLSVLLNDKDDPASAERKYSFGWAASPGGANFTDTSGWATLLLDYPEGSH